MRRVQVFKNEVKIDTKYDNTAYIIALGAILSDGAIGAIDELKKINAKPFSTYSKEWQRKWERRF